MSKQASRSGVKYSTTKFCLVFVTVWSGVLLGVQSAQAATKTWAATPASVNWSLAENWGGAVPEAGDSVVFATSSATILNNDLAAAFAIGGITFNSGASAFTNAGNAITLGGNIADNATSTETINFDMALSGTRSVDVVSGGTLVIGGIVSGETFGVTKTGAGTLKLLGTNLFTGAISIQAGTLLFNSVTNVGPGASALGAPADAASGIIDLYNGATLTFTGPASMVSDRQIRLKGTGTSAWTIGNRDSTSGKSMTWSGDFIGAASGAAGNRTINLSANNWGNCPLIVTGAICDVSPSNATIVTAWGGGGVGYNRGSIQLLNEANTFSGQLQMGYGTTLTITKFAMKGMPSSLGTGTSDNSLRLGTSGSSYGATLNYVGLADSITDRQLLLSNGGGMGFYNDSPNNSALSFVGTSAWSGSQGLTLGGSSTATNLICAPIAGISALAINTSGGWVLSGTNTFTGTTTVTKGALSVNGSLASLVVNVSAGGTLAGTGSITGAVNIATGGKLVAGFGTTGTLNMQSNLTFSASATNLMAIAGKAPGQSTSVRVTNGNVVLANAVLVVDSAGYQYTGTGTIPVIEVVTEGKTVSGTFLNLQEGATVKTGNLLCTISYSGGDGNDVVLKIVSKGTCISIY